MPDHVGQQIGNYRLLRLLGRGGFAEVYLGEHIYLKRQAALKLLLKSLEDEDVAQFLAEAQTLARFNHPNIVRVLEFSVADGTPVLVMDYAPRGTLRQRHPRGTYLSLETTVRYTRQVAAALQYAHNHQVIHRDVKPENILLGSNRDVLLSDFGISVLAPSTEQLSTQEMAGTIPYMAPEQLRGKPNFASDQYSLGIVVYEWLCGIRPFEGSQWQIAHQQVFEPPPRLREKDPSLPQEVEDVVLKALAKDPQQRYASVQLFAQALERANQERVPDLSSYEEATAPLPGIAPKASVPSRSRRVFLSASQEDETFVTRLKADLQRRGIAVWHESPQSTPHTSTQEDIVRQAMRAVDVVVLIVSPHTPSSHTVKEHLRIASLYQRRLVFVWTEGEDIAAALPGDWGKTVLVDLIDARQRGYEQVLDEMIGCLEDEASAVEPALSEPAFEPRNPYKGLRAFRADDAADFFGRDSLIEELTARLKEVITPGTSSARLLAVIGPSGSGKSSVVMAGLLPRLQQDALPGSKDWVYLEPMVPGTHPLEALALTLVPRFPDRSVKTLHEDLQDASARGLHRLAAQLVKTPEQKVVLFIDQFEELFTLTSSEQEREQFIDLLVSAMTEPQGSLIVILTLRADLYDRPLSYRELGRLIVGHQFVVLPMEVHDLRAAIKGPAALPDVQLNFEGTLVGDLLFEVQGQAGALPLVQFTLEQLFERRNGHTLTQQAYHEIGGVKGALAKHAEATYTGLPSEEHRRLSRALFLRLIDPGITEQDTTRRRAALSELELSTAEETEVLQQVTAYFLAARLLTTNEVGGTPTIEVSHEALIREWPRLFDWLREAREDIRLQQTLSEDVAAWQQHGKARDRLYRGSQLKRARIWAKRNIPSRDEVEYLRASAAQRLRSLVSVVAIVLLVLSTTGFAGWLLFLTKPTTSSPTLVTTLKEDGPGSLRQAIAAAKAGSTITFAMNLKGVILLKEDDLRIPKNLTIRGPGAGILAISSGKSNYQVNIHPGVSVTLSGLIFKDRDTGQTTLVTNGFINNEGTLTLINSIVSGNRSTATDPGGGGIFNDFGSTLTLINSIVSGNTVLGGDGGGIDNIGTLTLINSTVSHNTGGLGSGIENDGTLTIANSTISGNTGRGIDNYGTLTMTNSTISGNTGRGIAIRGGSATITFCTIYNNSSIGDNSSIGGGISITETKSGGSKPTQVVMRNSIVARNQAPTSPDISGTLTSDGYNLIQSFSGATFTPNQQHHTDLSGDNFPNLRIDSVLRDNGGLAKPHTLTLALLPGSPALDKIPLQDCQVKVILNSQSRMYTDQRGVTRPDENEQFCDIGAYESSP